MKPKRAWAVKHGSKIVSLSLVRKTLTPPCAHPSCCVVRIEITELLQPKKRVKQ